MSSIENLGKGFLEVFVTFVNMVSEILGIKAYTKKGDIGASFANIVGDR
ncbi:Variable outer membrane protein [Borrelia duttonii CR2A]|uniref:Variable large protein n=1 Tax=Borrelia duttonii CR2A TaxID=1432657 RepID=W6TFM5_9SPIR|nr:Variable outer membrane protein [Borrelia duttonii CR2A]